LKNNEVEYQVKGNYGKVDFLVNDMIVDTKYKPKYKKNKGYKHQIEDIRQLSGYARDEKIRTCLKIDKNQLCRNCLLLDIQLHYFSIARYKRTAQIIMTYQYKKVEFVGCFGCF
jgi:hypothetical protein